MMPDQQRRENHTRYGLAMCTQILNNVIEDDSLFFAAVNQIKQGGPVAVHEPSQMIVFAELNLKAGMRSIDLCDYNTAFTLFQYGRTFLGDDNWTLHYQLSLDVHDSLADAALILNKLSVVTSCSDEVALHARCFEDKVRCKLLRCDFCSIPFLLISQPKYIYLVQACAMSQKLLGWRIIINNRLRLHLESLSNSERTYHGPKMTTLEQVSIRLSIIFSRYPMIQSMTCKNAATSALPLSSMYMSAWPMCCIISSLGISVQLAFAWLNSH